MAREHIHLLMAQHILVNGPKDATMESDNAYGRMAEYTRENGGMGRHMGTVSKNESMERYDMKACGITIFQSENDDDIRPVHHYFPTHTAVSLTMLRLIECVISLSGTEM